LRVLESRAPAVITSLAAFANATNAPDDAPAADALAPLLSAEDMQWLANKVDEIHDASIMKLADGTPVYSPMGYGGVWTRDMYYVSTVAAQRVAMKTVAGVVELFLKQQRPDCSVPKKFSVVALPGYVCWAVRGGFDAVELSLDE